jgi:hypothetical protein
VGKGKARLGIDKFCNRNRGVGIAYALGGEDLCVLVAPTPRGLPLPEREAGAFGVADIWDCGGGTAAVLCDDGDAVVAGGADERTSPNDGLSWGAGDGAIAIAVLMIGGVARGGAARSQKRNDGVSSCVNEARAASALEAGKLGGRSAANWGLSLDG